VKAKRFGALLKKPKEKFFEVAFFLSSFSRMLQRKMAELYRFGLTTTAFVLSL
jgi:hypothetical protein